MKTVLAIIFALAISSQVISQESIISGTVTSANDKFPLIGASVLVKGKTKGVVTDFDGNYNIKAQTNDVLVFAYVGYVTKEVIVKYQDTISVALEEHAEALDEVVVIGYGTTKKRAITGAVSKVSSGLSGSVRGVSVASNAPRYGQLTAGEINDIENWKEWLQKLKYREQRQFQDNWSFYLENRIVVNVNDKQTKPINNIKVSLYNDSNELIMTSKTDVTGKAILFKDLNTACCDDFYRIQVEHENSIVGRKITNAHKTLNFVLNTQNPSNTIDVMFTIDATGSMGDEIAYLKSELKNIISRVDKSIEKKRVALTFYRDYGDAYVVKDFDFNSNIDAVKEILSHQSAGGGGDYEEAVEKALQISIEKSWNLNSKSKLLFLLLDAPPHFTDKNVAIIKQQIKLAQAKGIKIIPIVASGANKEVEFLMRFFSVSTNGTYVFLTDDSGIGNPHLKPTANDFKVEKLNDLIVRLIEKYSGVIS